MAKTYYMLLLNEHSHMIDFPELGNNYTNKINYETKKRRSEEIIELLLPFTLVERV